MSTNINAATLTGIQSTPINVEVELLRRLPGVCLVGLPAMAVRETAERVRSAIAASGLEFPRQRVVVNLTPSSWRVDSSVDLALAVGIAKASGQVKADTDNLVFAAELSLEGRLRPVRGVVVKAHHARECDQTLVVPEDQVALAQSAGARVLGFRTLSDVVAYLQDPASWEHTSNATYELEPEVSLLDGSLLVPKSPHAVMALALAVAGNHSLLLLGPPGCKKTGLARRAATLLPPMTYDEASTVRAIHEAAGLLNDVGVRRPFRAPHHTVSTAGLIGDRMLRPGELCLAHHGVLLLDEVDEFPRSQVEVIQKVRTSGKVLVQRAEGPVTFPAEFVLIGGSQGCGVPGFDIVCDVTRSPQGLACSPIDHDRLDRLKMAVAETRQLSFPCDLPVAERVRLTGKRLAGLTGDPHYAVLAEHLTQHHTEEAAE